MSIQKNELVVKDVMLENHQFPIVRERILIKETLDKMNEYSIGIACIVDDNMTLKAVFCDGDIRRTIISNQQTLSAFFVDDVFDHAVTDYKFVTENTTLLDAVKLMGKSKIWDLPVIDSSFKLKGLLHLHPAILSLLN
tara:strand:- start:1188 stop:1601 length:414 start_codon:yes stop_codon:yes gene_type:complete